MSVIRIRISGYEGFITLNFFLFKNYFNEEVLLENV